jgi:hypothetical protein
MTGKDAAKAFTDFINGAGSSAKKEFVETMMREHRTLQQESFNLFLDCMEAWSKLNGTELYDDRNKFAVVKSREIMEAIR